MSLLESVRAAVPDRFDRFERALLELLAPVEERPTVREALRTAGRAWALLAGLGAVAWASGLPYLFPSLGPSAYAMAVSPSAATSQPQRVFGGHLFGAVGGFAAYHLLAPGLAVTHLPPALSAAGLRLAASAVLAVWATSVAMLATDLRHAPACATTLIVALGLLTTPVEIGVLLTAILTLVAVDHLLPGFGGVEDPPQ